MAQMFLEGGAGMWLVLALGMIAIGAALAYARGNTQLRTLAWGLVVGCVVLGAGLMIHSRDRIEDVIVNVDPSLAEELRSVGYREASRPLQLGAVFAVLGAAIAGLAEAKRGTSS